jgi:hypothetical protein
MQDNVMRLKGPKSNQSAIKATMNGFLSDAIRDFDLALVRMRGESGCCNNAVNGRLHYGKA